MMTGGFMKLLVISDLHAVNSNLDKLEDELNKADAVLFGGDFAECFKPETGKSALEALTSKHDTIFSVLGNCDNEDFLEEMENQDVSVERSLVFHDKLTIANTGGGTKFTGKTEFEREEDEILSDFNIVLDSVEQTGDKSLWNSLILICHNPPKGQKCDAVNSDLHAGSQKFTDFILEHQPLAVICGHIHEGVSIENIGKTLVINPGPLAEGNYAWLEITKEADSWNIVNSQLCKLS